eukprot:224521-Pyramimonas_sp.AAC.1
MHYNVGGLVMDPHLRATLRPPEHAHIDWMHALVASGGIAQFEVNDVLRQLASRGVPTNTIDDFHASITWPFRGGNLPKGFFSNRLGSQNKPLRCFPSETLAAVK